MRFLGLIAALLLATACSASTESDTDAVMHLFEKACLPNIGQPEAIRQWAAANHLQPISDARLLSVFVGPGQKGAAWGVPKAGTHLALSIRGTTEACAVWAERADPTQATERLTRIIQGTAKSGLQVKEDPGSTTHTQFGVGKMSLFQVGSPDRTDAFEFLLLTSERPGGLFQVGMQVSRVQAH